MSKALVCGGRLYSELSYFNSMMDSLRERFDITKIVHGAATGADSLADVWAHRNHIPVTAYSADWKNIGKAAGIVRNQKMLDEEDPDLVIAFPGGRGTEDMCSRAREAKITVLVIPSLKEVTDSIVFEDI